MQLPIKGRREKESISEIQSKPTPAGVTAKTALISHPFARWYRTGAVPQSLSLKAATSARTNAPKRAEPISGHPAPGTLRHGITEPCHRLRIRTISAARANPYAPAPFGCVRRKRRNRIPHNRGGRNACAPPFAVCTNVPALIKESYLCHTEGGTTPALCHSQNERSRPRKRRNNIPNSSERYARALPFAVCTNVPVLIKES